MSDGLRFVLTSAGIGLVAGMRSMSAMAVVGSSLASGPIAGALKLLAAAEMIADKTPLVPDRTDPISLVGRVAIGGIAAALLAGRTGRSMFGASLIGASAAAGSTYLFYVIRRRAAEATRVPDAVFGAVEDGLVVAVGSGVAALVPPR